VGIDGKHPQRGAGITQTVARMMNVQLREAVVGCKLGALLKFDNKKHVTSFYEVATLRWRS
jgi:hypothetical protein